MPNLVGQDLGRYHITEQLGEGGMATVYKAFDSRLERNVALKIIRADVGDGADMLKRFEREAKALAQLTHPNIVHIDDYGEQGGMPYVVMDYLPGGTLKQKLGRPMPYDEAARLLAPIARALEYAHQQKIIHRDVKPANILLTQSGAPMLTDFGIAKILESKGHTELTGTGVGLGTPDYMAPEQWFGKAETRTDIYALGIVLYELVTGRRPFTADTPAAVLIKHVNDPLPDPRQYVRDLPGRVEQVLLKALAKNVVDRYQTMGEFAAALEQLGAPSRPERTQVYAPPASGAAATVLVPVAPGPGTSAQRLGQSQAMAGVRTQSQPSLGTPPPPRPAAALPKVEAKSTVSRNAFITVGVIALVALCLAGGIVGGIALYSQFSSTPTGATSPAVVPSSSATAQVAASGSAASPTAQATASAIELTPTAATPTAPSATVAFIPPTRTATRVPPTRTPTHVPPTPTPIPPTATATLVPPTATAIPTATPTALAVTPTPFSIIIFRPPLLPILLASPTPTFIFIIQPILPKL